jgi:hypothetical protein
MSKATSDFVVLGVLATLRQTFSFTQAKVAKTQNKANSDPVNLCLRCP